MEKFFKTSGFIGESFSSFGKDLNGANLYTAEEASLKVKHAPVILENTTTSSAEFTTLIGAGVATAAKKSNG
jgi:hypothetical protein